MTFQVIKMEVAKSTATGKRELVGEVDIYVPTLADAGVTGAEVALDKDGKTPLLDDDGLLVYTDAKYAWLAGAIYTQVKAQARNRLKPQSLELKSELGIADTWEMLTANNLGGGGNPEALIKAREVKTLFATFIASLGKSAKAQAIITGLFNKLDALEVADADSKTKIKGYTTDFATSLTAEQLTKYEKNLQRVLDMCDTDSGDW